MLKKAQASIPLVHQPVFFVLIDSLLSFLFAFNEVVHPLNNRQAITLGKIFDALAA
jgi:hypothetical protein